MTASYEETLLDLADEDPRLFVMTAENRAPIRGVPAALGARFLDVGIAEQTMVGMAAGLALSGRVPVVHALASFLTMRAFEFIRTDVGIPGLPVKLVGTVPGILSEANGPTHQALEDVSLLSGIPNMRVFCPADVEDLVTGLPEVLRDPAPWYIRFCDRPAVAPHEMFEIGVAEVFAESEGDDVALVVMGALFSEAWQLAELLRAKRYAVRVINVRCAAPFDDDAILRAAAATGLIVTIEDHFARGGLYSRVCETLVSNQEVARVLPISCGDAWFKPALLNDALAANGFSPADMVAQIRAVLAGRPTVSVAGAR